VAAFIASGLPLSSNISVSARTPLSRFMHKKLPLGAVTPAMLQASAPSYDKLIQDDSSRNMLRFNSTTGEYLFSRCSDGFTLAGAGTVTRHGSTYTLTHNPSDRRVQASLDTTIRRGTASLQFPPGTTILTITDRDTSNNPGLSDNSAPQVKIEAPDGGEIIDAGTQFTVNWIVSDNAGIASQDVLLSTNGGATFSTVATGLPGSATEYQWTAPIIADNRQMRLRVVARDAACNVSRDDSDSNFTLLNPPASFTHTAEAPIYMASGDFNADIHLCNVSSSPVVVELAFRKPSDGEANAPAQISLAAGAVRKVKASDYLTLPAADEMVEGSIRLRHNGPGAEAVRAMVAVDRLGDDQSFTVPFVYAASAQSAQSAIQYSPLYYVGDSTHAYLALQNCKNYPVSVSVKCVYGTGQPGTPGGSYTLMEVKIGGQRRLMVDLASMKEEFYGAEWGSVVLTAPPRTVVAHMVMKSAKNRLAFSSPFVDPAMASSTTKVAGGLKLDYNAGLRSCVMVCNTSAQERFVTASFKTDTGVTVPSQQFTLPPGGQRLLELNSRQVLGAGQSAMADLRLTYAGNGPDIVAGGVSMSAVENCAIGAQFIEPRSGDGQQLMSPFFRMDARTRGVVQVSNLGTNRIRAGVSLKFANAVAPPLTTELITVEAGSTACIDLQKQLDRFPDGITAEGCLMLTHNGPPGTATASFIAVGMETDLAFDNPLSGVPPMPPGQIVMYPEYGVVVAGDSTPVLIFTGGSPGPFTFGSSEGTVTPLPTSDPGVSGVTFTSDDEEDGPDTVTITVTSPTGTGTVELVLQKVKLSCIQTSNAQGDTRGRLNPDGGTTFRLTANKPFPPTNLVVRFQQGDKRVEVTIPNTIETTELTGQAPANTEFIGDVGVQVRTTEGKKVSKKTVCDEGPSPYYAFDPPSPPTGITPSAMNRDGGNATITGSGFRVFLTEEPDVNVGTTGFRVDAVTSTTIVGKLKNIDREMAACPDSAPCYFIEVRNPGGKNRDWVTSAFPLFTLQPGPAPIPTGLSPTAAPSRGGTMVTIRGTNFFVVNEVTIGGVQAPIVARGSDPSTLSDTLTIEVPPGVCPPGGKVVNVIDVDKQFIRQAPATFTITPTDVSSVTPVLTITVEAGSLIPGAAALPVSVGPCESITVTPTSSNFGTAPNNCGSLTVVANRTGTFPRSTDFLVNFTANARQCTNDPGPQPAQVFTFVITISNTFSGAVSRSIEVVVTMTR
jgi:hypothetical protein